MPRTGPITDFLNAAWNGGNQPVYVIMSVYFTGDALLNSGAVSALAQQYHDLDKKYAAYPAVMGTAISNENRIPFNTSTTRRGGRTSISSRRRRSKASPTAATPRRSSRPQRLTEILRRCRPAKRTAPPSTSGASTSTAAARSRICSRRSNSSRRSPRCSPSTVLRQRTIRATVRPTRMAPGPTALGSCSAGTGPLTAGDVAELPATGNPNMAGLVDYVTNNASLLYSGFTTNSVVSGGFYFEWTDEWWKANGGNNSVHLGSVAPNGAYPGMQRGCRVVRTQLHRCRYAERPDGTPDTRRIASGLGGANRARKGAIRPAGLERCARMLRGAHGRVPERGPRSSSTAFAFLSRKSARCRHVAHGSRGGGAICACERFSTPGNPVAMPVFAGA